MPIAQKCLVWTWHHFINSDLHLFWCCSIFAPCVPALAENWPALFSWKLHCRLSGTGHRTLCGWRSPKVSLLGSSATNYKNMTRGGPKMLFIWRSKRGRLGWPGSKQSMSSFFTISPNWNTLAPMLLMQKNVFQCYASMIYTFLDFFIASAAPQPFFAHSISYYLMKYGMNI